jgi:hypothetical protein
MAKITIGPKHPIRTLVLDLKTYYDCKGRFVEDLCKAFDACDLDVVCSDMDGDEGRANFVIRPKDTTRVCCDECAARMDAAAYDNWLVVTWYRISAACIEFVAYVS